MAAAPAVSTAEESPDNDGSGDENLYVPLKVRRSMQPVAIASYRALHFRTEASRAVSAGAPRKGRGEGCCC